MTCIECGQPPVVFPDNVSLSVRWVAGNEYICMDNDSRGQSETPWCGDHFPSWLIGIHRVPRTHKPHIPAADYGGMVDDMRQANTRANTAFQRIQEAARAGADAARHFVESYGHGESA